MPKLNVIDQNTGNLLELDLPLAELSAALAPTSRAYGHTQIVTSGVAVVLGDGNVAGGSVVVKALAGNTDIVYVGEAGVTASGGFELSAGEVWLFPSKTLGELYINGHYAGDGVCYWAS